MKPYPVGYALSEFAPGGSSAIAAQSIGKYYHIRKDTDLDDFIVQHRLKEGLYYVEGKIKIDDDVLGGRVTLVATDEIEIKSKKAAFESFTRCLLAFSGKHGKDFTEEGIEISGESSRFQGAMFAPFSGIEFEADGSVLLGSLIGRGVEVAGHDIKITGIDLSACPPLVAPLIPTRHENELEISFLSYAGLTYVIECSDSLTKPKWQEVAVFIGDGAIQTLRSPRVVPQRFYRLRVD